MNNYWISWHHDTIEGAFELHSPWWHSGWDAAENAIICAAIKAKSKKDAKQVIYESYDKKPNHIKFRFCMSQRHDWMPYTDRFQKADWMKWENEEC